MALGPTYLAIALIRLVGVVLRSVRYVANTSMWLDESRPVPGGAAVWFFSSHSAMGGSSPTALGFPRPPAARPPATVG